MSQTVFLSELYAEIVRNIGIALEMEEENSCRKKEQC